MLHIPLILTFIRLFFAPLIFPILLFYFWSEGINIINLFLCLFFVFLCITDFLDGYFARRLNQETQLGRALDPIADKFLIYPTLVTLLALNKIYFYWVILLIGREFFVMALRIIALEKNIVVHASGIAKFKTAVQMVVLIFIILSPYTLANQPRWYCFLSMALIVSAIFFAFISAFLYTINLMKKLYPKSKDS